jgi:adenylate cyclase
MKNLEIKLQLDQTTLNNLVVHLKPYYSETLIQTDTYFVTKQGRLKLREENGKKAYLIRYQRPDLEEPKESDYLFYSVDNVTLFLSVLGDSLREELKVKKRRALYFPKPHLRVHLDQVENLGDFLEIEIILSEEVPLSTAETEMRELQQELQLLNLKKIDCGYRELLKKMKD